MIHDVLSLNPLLTHNLAKGLLTFKRVLDHFGLHHRSVLPDSEAVGTKLSRQLWFHLLG